jgi:hydrogenase-4 component F
MNFIIVLAVFLLASAAAAIMTNEKAVRTVSVIAAFVGGGAVFALALPVLFGFSVSWSNQLLLVDRFSALMAALVAFVYVAATMVSARYIGHEHHEGIVTANDVRLYFSLLHLFVLSMVVTVLTNNTLLLWLALEGTTLSSTFLVGLYRKKTSVEAAWKYIIICSTGISLGLIGILLLGYGSRLAGVTGIDMFLLTSLMHNAPLLQAATAKLAFVFLFIGFGAKVGLAPMHTWLPDAHSKAPSPISGLFSGILLNVALYAIMRFAYIVNGALDSGWTSNFYLVFGTASIVLSALMMIVQTNYKRMLAYSSIEHMGLISFALGLSPLGVIAAVIHMIGHTLTKSLLFFGAGEILLRWKTTTVDKVKSVYSHDRYTAILFLFGILAIVAMPPSALFVSEYAMFANAVALHPLLALLLFVSLSVIAYSMLRLVVPMLFAQDGSAEAKPHRWNITHTIMLVQLTALVCFAVWVTSEPGLTFVQGIANDAVYTSSK